MDKTGAKTGVNIIFIVDPVEFKRFATTTASSVDFIVYVGFCRLEMRVRGDALPPSSFWSMEGLWDEDEDDEDEDEDENEIDDPMTENPTTAKDDQGPGKGGAGKTTT